MRAGGGRQVEYGYWPLIPPERVARATLATQVVWLADGHPVAVASPAAPLYWPMVPGRRRFQIRLPLQDDASRPLVLVVE